MREDVMREGDALPPGWLMPQIGDILEVTYGKGLPERDRNTAGQIPVYGSNGVVGHHSRALVDGPCIIIGRKGAAGAVHLSRTPCWPIDTTYFTQPPPELSLEYIYVILRSLNLQSLDRSTAIPGLNRDDLYAQRIPLPPLPEQRRIVAEIEKQFTRLDAGIAALKRVQANLKRYRASVLKAACEGRLAPQDLADEPADRLLARILTERRAKWEAEHPGKKYVEPAAVVTDGLSELPEGWSWASVEQACDRIVDCLHSTPVFSDEGRLCVDSNCIEPGRIVLERARYVDESTFEERNRRMTPLEDDVVFSREGALLGIAVRVPVNLPFCLGQRMMIFRPSAVMLGRFFEHVLNSSVFRSQYRVLVTGTAAPHLNIGDIRLLAVPVPQLSEQHRIVADVERRLSVVAELEATVAANLARAGRLRQAVLKRAFEGRLVAPDADDEPADMLLARIHTPCPSYA
jgi:type I restriction enzyme S subunit